MGGLQFLEKWLERFSDLHVAALSFLILIVVTRFILKKTMYRKDQKEVPEPPGLPVIGHLHLFGKLPHQMLMKLGRQYGPLIMVRLGGLKTIVASNAQMAEELLKTQDVVWGSRPQTLFAEILFYKDISVVLQPMNDSWRQMKKLYMSEILGPTNIERQKDERHETVMRLVNSLLASQQDNLTVNITSTVADMNFYHMSKLVLGKRLTAEAEMSTGEEITLSQLVSDLTHIEYLALGECFPSLRWLDLDKVESRMRKLHRVQDKYLTRQIETRRRLLQDKDDDTNDFLCTLLRMLDNKEVTLPYVKAVVTEMFLAGVESTVTTVTAAVAEILRHPEVKQQIIKELDDVVGRDRLMQESDCFNFKYLKLVIKESMRLHPPIPLLVTHLSAVPSVVAGYHIPANTQLFVNVYAIHRDPERWEDPLAFKPERFLDSSVDLRGHDFDLLPFGSGRRICPGLNFGLTFVEFVLGRLFHSLDIQLPPGMKPEDVDMSEKSGAAVSLANPVKAVVSPRLPLELYSK